MALHPWPCAFRIAKHREGCEGSLYQVPYLSIVVSDRHEREGRQVANLTLRYLGDVAVLVATKVSIFRPRRTESEEASTRAQTGPTVSR